RAKLAAVILAFGALTVQPAVGQPLDPVYKLTTGYTDRSLIHIGIVGSTSGRPDVHRLAQAEPPSTDSAGCLVRVRSFVDELTRTFDQRPLTAIDPILELLRRYFPVEHCNIQRTIEIAQNSPYFVEVSESPNVYVILFDSNKSSRHAGIRVQ